MRPHLLAFAAVAATALPATAQELPTRRPGLWQITMTRDDGQLPPQVMQQCTDAATDRLMNAFGSDMAAGFCSNHSVQRVGASLVINAVCQIGPMRTTSQSVVTGDFNSGYTVKVTSKVEGVPQAVQGMAGGTSTIQARWVGPCQAGQQPGDVILANGQRMNIRDIKKALGGAPSTPKK